MSGEPCPGIDWFGLMDLFDHVMTVYVFMSVMYLESTAISVKVWKAIVEKSSKQLLSVQCHQHTHLLQVLWKLPEKFTHGNCGPMI